MPRTSAREDGFTLIELVTVTGLLMMVAVSMLTAFNIVSRASVRQGARSEAIDDLRLAVQRMTKDIRQTTDVRSGSGAAYLDIDTIVNGLDTRVTYDATSGDTLVRTVDGVSETILERLRSNSIFTYTPDVADPSVITLVISIDPARFASDDDPVDVTSEVDLRNRSAA